MYYSSNELRSKNRILNFIIGMRSNGKTYAMKKMCINNFLKKGQQFVWVRRYKTELTTALKQSWFQDIGQEFPKVSYMVKGNEIYLNDKLCGWFIPLSKQQHFKSVSFQDVTIIVFDEFLVTSGSALRYMKDEPVMFLELMSTITRLRNNVNAFFVANAFSVVNPYFLYFEITPNIRNRFTMTDSVCIEITATPQVAETMKQTRLGKLISGTRYGDYAIETDFFQDNEEFIMERQGNLSYMCTLLYRDLKIGVWYGNDYVYCDMNIEENNNRIISMTTEDMTTGAMYKTHKDIFRLKEVIGRAFKEGRLYYNNQAVKQNMYEFIHHL